MSRKAKIVRKTTETDINLDFALEQSDVSRIETSIPFLNHMLELFVRHGRFWLVLQGKGDTEIDDHHLTEDVGICLGKAVAQALGDKTGINRYGSAFAPMDESLCHVDIDISGRPYLVYRVRHHKEKIGGFEPALVKEFFKAFADHSGITVHINLAYGSNNHHIFEAVFKAFARALRQAVDIHPEISGVLSTKGMLE